MNLVTLLEQHAQAQPDAIALVHGPRQCTFAELNDRSQRGAEFLQSRDMAVGDHVLVLMPMGIQLYEILLASWRLGLVVVVVDPAAGAAAFDHAVQRLRPKMYIASGKALMLRWRYRSLGRIPQVLASHFPWWYRRWRQCDQCPRYQQWVEVDAQHPALITFTAGSTGQPKGAVRSHGLLAQQHQAIAQALHHDQHHIELATLPIFALASLASGIKTVIPAVDLTRVGQVKADTVLAAVNHHGVGSATASPAFFQQLLAQKTSLPFRSVFTGGAPIFPRLWQQLDEALLQGQAVAVYGSTEAEPIAHISWDELSADDKQAMSQGAGLIAGFPVPQISCRIIDLSLVRGGVVSAEQWSSWQCPSPHRGEIVVCGDHVLPGYLDGIGDDQHKIMVADQVWHRTGDSGYMDDHGRLWLTGRVAAIIDDEHGRCYPLAVEAAASNIPGVARTACVAYRQQRTLLVQYEHKYPDPISMVEHPSALVTLAQHYHAEITLVDRIPVDRRHQAKIDYPAVTRLLDHIHESTP